MHIVGRTSRASRNKVGGLGIPTLIVVTDPAGSEESHVGHQLAAAVGHRALRPCEIKDGMIASNQRYPAVIGDPLTMADLSRRSWLARASGPATPVIRIMLPHQVSNCNRKVEVRPFL
jgi:hypothetical protein